MAMNTLTFSQKYNIVTGHVCSKCGNPVLIPVTINIAAGRMVGISRAHTEALLQEDIVRVMNQQINRIVKSRTWRYGLGYQVEGEENGVSWAARYNGIKKPCPNCRNEENWQQVSPSKKELNRLKEENFPLVFTTVESANDWVSAIVKRNVSVIEAARTDAVVVENAKIEADALHEEIEQLLHKKRSLPEKTRKEELERQYLLLQNQVKNHSKMKGTVKAEAQILSLRMEDIGDFINHCQKEIDELIVKKRSRLENLQAMAYGCTGQSSSIEYQGALCYLVQANPILKENKDNESTCQKYCPTCGFMLLEGSRFCSMCGQKINQ